MLSDFDYSLWTTVVTNNVDILVRYFQNELQKRLITKEDTKITTNTSSGVAVIKCVYSSLLETNLSKG